MFKRLIYEEWQSIIPVAAFVQTAIGFVILSIRAIYMKPEKSNHMANLPLSDAPANQEGETGGVTK